MKIMICGSMTFAKEMVEAQKKLEALGHDAEVPCDTEEHVNDPNFIDDLEKDKKHCIENQIMEKCFKKIEENDAIVVLNYPKNGIKGYIGTASLMEIGIARHFGKKIFLLNPPPHHSEVRWAHEVSILQPIILNGDLSEVK